MRWFPSAMGNGFVIVATGHQEVQRIFAGEVDEDLQAINEKRSPACLTVMTVKGDDRK